MTRLRQSWCANCRYPGFKPFMFGTVVLEQGCRLNEVEAALAALWAEISPHPPPSFEPIPGALFYNPDG